MTTWKCSSCGYTLSEIKPPEVCPSCKEPCEYLDVSCYIPGCGGPSSGNINTQVFQQNSDENV